MIYGLYHSAAGMMTNEYRQSVIANNLANADTAGFKQDIATFAERTPESLLGYRNGDSADHLANLSGGTWLGQTYTDHSNGTLVKTGVDTDIALEGSGYFTVKKDGETLLTRDGRMIADDTGRLINAATGASLLGLGGAPIRIPRSAAGDINIDENGFVHKGKVPCGQIRITDVKDVDELTKVGGGFFRFEEENLAPPAARVRHRFVEQSGVEPIREMVNMIETSRAYQMNAQMVSLQDQSVGKLISIIS